MDHLHRNFDTPEEANEWITHIERYLSNTIVVERHTRTVPHSRWFCSRCGYSLTVL